MLSIAEQEGRDAGPQPAASRAAARARIPVKEIALKLVTVSAYIPAGCSLGLRKLLDFFVLWSLFLPGIQQRPASCSGALPSAARLLCRNTQQHVLHRENNCCILWVSSRHMQLLRTQTASKTDPGAPAAAAVVPAYLETHNITGVFAWTWTLAFDHHKTMLAVVVQTLTALHSRRQPRRENTKLAFRLITFLESCENPSLLHAPPTPTPLPHPHNSTTPERCIGGAQAGSISCCSRR